MLPAQYRLKEKKEFSEVFRCGSTISNEVLLMKYKKTFANETQIGFSVSLKFSKKSSKRNKVKRWMREAARALLEKIKKGHKIIFLANSKFPYERMDYSLIKKKEEDLLKRAKLIK